MVSSSIHVRRASEGDLKDICRIMLSTDPYLTLRYTEDMCYDVAVSGLEEGWVGVAEYGGEVAGFIIFRVFDGFPLGGYVRALAVDERFRGMGVGRALMSYAEEKIFRYRRNVFLLVSSFNYRTMRFYRSLGYEPIGEIKDAIIEGASEYIFRKKRPSTS